MTDKELLELAALAAGVECDAKGPFTSVSRYDLYNGIHTVDLPWDPLTDDGDAYELETTLGLSVTWYELLVIVGPRYCGIGTGSAYAEYFDEHNGNKRLARRLAGVKAAAEIGKSMKGQK